MFFSDRSYPACQDIANGIKPGSNSKTTDKHAANCSKTVCVKHKVNYVRCINCSYNNLAKGIRLLDKKAIFVYTQVGAFDSNIPLSAHEYLVSCLHSIIY